MTTPLESTTSVPIADPDVGTREIDAVREVLSSGQLSAGEQVDAFRSEFADYCGVDHGVATCNGTAALHAALEALDIGRGDTVVTTPFSFVATANAIRLAGADPLFADVDASTYNLDPHAVESAIRDHGDVDAILAVHLYGLPAAMDHLRDVAESHGVPLIEDAAQAHGAEFDGSPVGSLGDVACFSFYPTKNMTTGEGGMIVTDRADVADRAASFVDHGRSEHYQHERLGHNYRMTDMAAAIGRIQLEKLPDYTDARRRSANQYTDAVRDGPIHPPSEPPERTHVYHQYTVRTPHRDALREHLASYGIDASVYYPTPIHQQPAYGDVDHSAPTAETLASEVLSVPVHPGLSNQQRRAVATALSEFDHE